MKSQNRIVALSVLLYLLLVGLSACSAAPAPSGTTATPVGSGPEPGARVIQTNNGSYKRVTAAQFAAMLQAKDFVLVNTHIPYAGEIANTDVFVPYNQISQQLAQLPADKQAKIVLYCRTGPMSATAAEALVAAGYTNVWDLEGGMAAWQQAGQQIISK